MQIPWELLSRGRDRAELNQGEDFPARDQPPAPRSADRQIAGLVHSGFRLARML
jgi:hypothetical protein